MTTRGTKNGRAVTREDLRDGIEALGNVVDEKFNRVFDGLTTIDRRIGEHVERNRIVEASQNGAIEALKKFKWITAGGLGMAVFLLKVLFKL